MNIPESKWSSKNIQFKSRWTKTQKFKFVNLLYLHTFKTKSYRTRNDTDTWKVEVCIKSICLGNGDGWILNDFQKTLNVKTKSMTGKLIIKKNCLPSKQKKLKLQKSLLQKLFPWKIKIILWGKKMNNVHFHFQDSGCATFQ